MPQLLSLSSGLPIQVPTQGAASLTTAAPEGLFQALLGALVSTTPPAQAPLAGAGAQEAPAAPQTVPQAPTPSPLASAPPAPPPVGTTPAPADAQAAPPALPVEVSLLPIRLTGPTPPVLARPTAQSVDEPESDPAPTEPEQETQPTQPQELMPQLLLAVQSLQVPPQGYVAVPAPEAAPADAPAPQNGIAPLEAPAEAQLDAFVQKAVRQVATRPEAPDQPEAKPAAKPTFGDLVKLVAEHEQPTGTRPAPPAPKADDPPEPVALPTETKLPNREVPTAPEGAADPAPKPPVEPEQVLRQVTRFVKVMVESKQSEVRLQLHPDHLGAIGVKLVVGEGTLRANLVAQDAAVKAALEANLDQLKARLSDQGLQVEQVHVTVGGESGFGQPQHSRQGDHRQQHAQPQPWRQNSRQVAEHAAGPSEPQRPTQRLRNGPGARLNSLA